MKCEQGWAIRQKQLADVKAIEDIGMEPWLSVYRECEKQQDNATEPGELKTAWPWVPAPGLKLVVPADEPINTAERRAAVVAFCRNTLALMGESHDAAAERMRGREEWTQRRNVAAAQHNWANIFHLIEQRLKLLWEDVTAVLFVPSGPHTAARKE